MEDLRDLRLQKEEKDRFLLRLEVVIGYISTISFLVFIFIASYCEISSLAKIIIIVPGSIIFAIGTAYAVKIEQTAGYYECGVCHNRYIPTYSAVFFAAHIGRTRHLKCPECKKKSWNKKVLSK